MTVFHDAEFKEPTMKAVAFVKLSAKKVFIMSLKALKRALIARPESMILVGFTPLLYERP